MKYFQFPFIPHSLVGNCLKMVLACNDCSLQFHLLLCVVSLSIKVTPYQASVNPCSQIFCWEDSPQCKPQNHHLFQAGFQGGPCFKEPKMLFQSGTLILSHIYFTKSFSNGCSKISLQEHILLRLLEFRNSYEQLTCKQRYFPYISWYAQSFVDLLSGMRC